MYYHAYCPLRPSEVLLLNTIFILDILILSSIPYISIYLLNLATLLNAINFFLHPIHSYFYISYSIIFPFFYLSSLQLQTCNTPHLKILAPFLQVVPLILHYKHFTNMQSSNISIFYFP